MNDFTIAVGLVLAHEGGYSNDPTDPGGETNFGISRRAHPDLDIAALTRDEAIDIYRRTYWTAAMESAPTQQLANAMLDCSVNQGPGACRTLYSDDLRTFQLRRLLRYAALGKPNDNHSWFYRTLDVG